MLKRLRDEPTAGEAISVNPEKNFWINFQPVIYLEFIT